MVFCICPPLLSAKTVRRRKVDWQSRSNQGWRGLAQFESCAVAMVNSGATGQLLPRNGEAVRSGAGRGNRTPTGLSALRILSPLRLPVSPSRRRLWCHQFRICAIGKAGALAGLGQGPSHTRRAEQFVRTLLKLPPDKL